MLEDAEGKVFHRCVAMLFEEFHRFSHNWRSF